LPAEMRAVALSSTSIYHVNMSVFRSAPDMWAIGQVCATSPPFPRAAERAKPRGVCVHVAVWRRSGFSLIGCVGVAQHAPGNAEFRGSFAENLKP
jgi:hypothetical protein